MKHKKLIATVAAATMLMSTMTALASTPTYEPADGDVNYVETKIYKLQLPTTASLKFTLDPQGLLTLGDWDGTTDQETYLAAGAGKIVGTAVDFVNWGSQEVKVIPHIYVADGDTANTLTLADDASTITNATTASKSLYLEFATNGEKSDGDTEAYTKICSINKQSADDVASVTDGFIMPAATYEFKENEGTYTYEMKADTQKTVKALIQGNVNKLYAWNAYTLEEGESNDDVKKLQVMAYFEFKDATGTDAVTYSTCTPAPAATATPEPSPTLSTESSTANLTAVDGEEWSYTATFTKGTDLVLTLTNGTISAVNCSGELASAATSTVSTVTKTSETTVTIASGSWAGASSGTPKYLVLTLSDSSTITIKIVIA